MSEKYATFRHPKLLQNGYSNIKVYCQKKHLRNKKMDPYGFLSITALRVMISLFIGRPRELNDFSRLVGA